MIRVRIVGLRERGIEQTIPYVLVLAWPCQGIEIGRGKRKGVNPLYVAA